MVVGVVVGVLGRTSFRCLRRSRVRRGSLSPSNERTGSRILANGSMISTLPSDQSQRT